MITKVEIRVYSVGGQYIGSLQNLPNKAIQSLSYTQRYLGGLYTFDLSLERLAASLIDLNQRIELWIDGDHVDTGYTMRQAQTTSMAPTAKPVIVGGFKLLEDITITEKNYAATTLQAVLVDLLTFYLPFSPLLSTDISQIVAPAVVITTLKISSGKLSKVLTDLLSIANFNGAVDTYRLWVDEQSRVCFQLASSEFSQLFAGIDYSHAELTEDLDKMVNTVTIVTSSDTPGTIVANALTMQDQGSAALYGVKSEVIMLPYVMDVDSVEKIGDTLLLAAIPIIKGSVEGIPGRLTHYGRYIISRSQAVPVWLTLTDVDDPDNWALTPMGGSAFSFDMYRATAPEPILHGIASLGIAISDAFGSYIDYAITDAIWNPDELELTYWTEASLKFKIQVMSLGVVVGEFSVESQDDTFVVDAGSGPDTMVVDAGAGPDTMVINKLSYQGIGNWQVVSIDLVNVLKIDTVRVLIQDSTSVTFYIDSIQVHTKRSVTQKLQLIEAKTTLTHGGLKTDITVGAPLDNLIDTLKVSESERDVLLSAIAQK